MKKKRRENSYFTPYHRTPRLASAWLTGRGDGSLDAELGSSNVTSPYESRGLQQVEDQFQGALRKRLEDERMRAVRDAQHAVQRRLFRE